MEIHIKNDIEEIIIEGEDLTWLPLYQEILNKITESKMEIA